MIIRRFGSFGRGPRETTSHGIKSYTIFRRLLKIKAKNGIQDPQSELNVFTKALKYNH